MNALEKIIKERAQEGLDEIEESGSLFTIEDVEDKHNLVTTTFSPVSIELDEPDPTVSFMRDGDTWLHFTPERFETNTVSIKFDDLAALFKRVEELEQIVASTSGGIVNEAPKVIDNPDFDRARSLVAL